MTKSDLPAEPIIDLGLGDILKQAQLYKPSEDAAPHADEDPISVDGLIDSLLEQRVGSIPTTKECPPEENINTVQDANTQSHSAQKSTPQTSATSDSNPEQSDSTKALTNQRFRITPVQYFSIGLLFLGTFVFHFYNRSSLEKEKNGLLVPIPTMRVQKADRKGYVPHPVRKSLNKSGTLLNILQDLDVREQEGTVSQAAFPLQQGESLNLQSPLEPPELELLVTAWDQQVIHEPIGSANERQSTIVKGYDTLAGIPESKASRQKKAGLGLHVIVRLSKVFSHPSNDALELAELRRGNRVEVVEQMGNWLKIASAQDRLGYILAANATPLAPK